MRESWRWFGPNDSVSLDDIRQAGATDIVSALHHIPAGTPWPIEEIRQRQQLIEAPPSTVPLRWSVVESIPVHEDIKLAAPGHENYIDGWIQTMENLAHCGIKVICYNFMPVIDWTRTDLRYKLPTGAYALRFDQKHFAVFDLFILKRDNAPQDYSAAEYAQAERLFHAMTESEKARLTDNIIAGLPGKMTDGYTLEQFRQRLCAYRGMTHEHLRDNLYAFLDNVLPVAEKLGVKLAIHPDDPPRDLLGLPRIICTADDLARLFKHNASPANGVTLCVGTFGSRPDNDLPAMVKQFGPRIHFAHLRGVSRDADEQRSFFEANHLDSDVDMVAVVGELLLQKHSIFMRPDHGHLMMDDISKSVNPGYSCIGRMKGLAEIRGVMRALQVRSTLS